MARAVSHPSVGGGSTSPLRAPDSRTLFYRQGGKIFRVPIATVPEFHAGPPEALISDVPEATPNISYDLSHDGKQFVIVKATDAGSAPEHRVVLHWIEELTARLAPRP